MKILIVDDKKENLYLLEKLLSGSGYEVETAEDGIEALEKLYADRFEMIISDILMPRMDGFQLCHKVKMDERLKHIAFVFYTATYTDPNDEKFALNLGAEKFIIKPQEPDVFIGIVKEVIRSYQSGMLSAPKAPVEEEAVYLKEYNERLIKKLEDKLLELEKKHRYETIINTVNRSVHSSTNLQDVLENSVEAIIANMDRVDNVSIFLVEGQDAVMKAHRGLPDWFVDRIRSVPFSKKGPLWKAITEGKPLYIPDAEKDTVIGSAGKELGIKSHAAIPIYLRGKTVGVINISSLQKSAFEKEELELLERIAQQIDVALNNAEQAEALRQSEERYRTLFDQSPVGVFIFDKELIIKQCNERFIHIMQSSYDQIIGFDMHKLRDQSYIPEIRKTLEGESSYYEGFYEATTSSAKLWLSVRLSPLRGAQGDIIGGMGVVEDITERKRMERALLESEERYRTFIEHTYDLIAEVSVQGTYLDISPKYRDILGYEASDVIGKSIFEYMHPDDRPEVMAEFQRAVFTFSTGKAVHRYKHKNGQWLWLESAGKAFRTIDGEIRGIIASRNITERKLAEEALMESQARLSGVIASAMDGIISVDSDQRIILFNSAAERMFMCPASEAIGQPLDRFIPERFRALHREHIRLYGGRGESTRGMGNLGAISGLRSNGEEFPIEASISQIEIAGKKIYTVILRDITERQRAEERLREQAELLDRSKDAIMVRDLDHRVNYWNKSAERLYGWTAEEVLGKNADELLYKEASSKLIEAEEAVKERGEWVGELNQITKDGREIAVESQWTMVYGREGIPKSILVVNTDVTEKKKLEAQFLRAQRLESIGTLAGGIAHDLNNVLTPIMMALQLLRQRFTDEDSQRWLDTLDASARRGADLIKQVLAFARGSEEVHTPIQFGYLISETNRILLETFPRSIEIKTDIPKDLWLISGERTQLNQVLMNLCVNARDAMPNGGRLSISAENLFIDDSYAIINIDAKTGPYVVVTVSDTGIGIPPEHLEKIFEPFFTTKEVGQGTGLGLSTAYRIVKDHGGFINVHSEVGKGTSFKVYLPAIETTETLDREKKKMEGLPPGRGQLILVVDDENSICEITRVALEAHGYNVIIANDGAEAVALYARDREKIEAVILDMVMPIMDGPETIRALLTIDPRAKIIAASGLMERNILTKVRETDVSAFLSKPYTANTLLNTLNEVLSAK